jgi:GT2 family glycosyltransferase
LSTPTLDILMITCRRPHYTRLSLPRLLESCDDTMRVWVWHNGADAETLEVVESLRSHPRFHRFHHSVENAYVRTPTNWLFREADGELLSVIADDCVVSDGWADPLRAAHHDVPELGVIACWHFAIEDYRPEIAEKKTFSFGAHRVLVNPWVQGSGVMIKRACVERMGLLPDRDRGFTGYCLRAAAAGWINGWRVPLVPIEHLDDPRSPRSALRTDADLDAQLPLSAHLRNVRTIEEWVEHLRRSAWCVQTAPSDPRLYVGLRHRMRRFWMRVRGESLAYGTVERASRAA